MHLLVNLPGGAEWLILIVGIVILVFWIRAIIEIANSRFQTDTTRIIWLLIVVFFGIIGTIIYYLAGRNTRVQ